MSTSSSLTERLAETRAAAAASMAVQILTETINEPATKRFIKSRPSRIERWLQLERVAREQISGLQALAKAPAARKKPLPKVAATGAPITPLEVAATQETA